MDNTKSAEESSEPPSKKIKYTKHEHLVVDGRKYRYLEKNIDGTM